MAAILMTSLLGADAELSWANRLKLLQTPQSLILYRSPKSSRNLHGTIFGAFDIDYIAIVCNFKCNLHTKFNQCAKYSKLTVKQLTEEMKS